MGTTWHVSIVDAPDAIAEQALQQGIEEQLEAVNLSMSTYRPDSEISRLNALETGTWFTLSPPFYQVLTTALDVGRNSEGAYDVTVAPLVSLWGFGPAGTVVTPPTDSVIEAALKQVGQEKLQLNEDTHAVSKRSPLSLDFSSLAKGYAVDQVALWLLDAGVERFLVEVGGEMRLAGLSARGDRWRIAIEQPDSGARAVAEAIVLTDVAVATSGDYRNYFEVDGQRYSHSIDPRTGQAVKHDLVSVTVVHPSAMLADAWATALTVLGAERAMAVAQAQGLAVYFIRRSVQGFDHSHTDAFAGYLEQSTPLGRDDPGNEP